ncbi:Hypothetical predicted protein [Octopus vulgaris]|uniref:Uncharacterized protein n=1 Tax=Octopus vulgaris TaxID=6645 RepID=A0AA36AJH0_OCTVU|nr:Hypothetical predicted protein [Octopus vulgaris]
MALLACASNDWFTTVAVAMIVVLMPYQCRNIYDKANFGQVIVLGDQYVVEQTFYSLAYCAEAILSRWESKDNISGFSPSEESVLAANLLPFFSWIVL